MKRRTALAVLLAAGVLVPLSHLEIEPADGSWLLRVDGRALDVAGQLSARWVAFTRDCRRVQPVPASAPAHAQVLATVRQYSPPDSLSADIVTLLALEPWWLVRVRFDALQEAVLLLQQTPEGMAIAPGGVWSGGTHPHRPEPLIRRYLRARVPEAPTALTDCLDMPA